MTSDPLARLLTQQRRIVGVRVAASEGVARAVLARAAARGALRRVHHGLYAEADWWDQATPWTRYSATVRAVLAGHPGWAASHHAALTLHGLPLVGVDLTGLDVAAVVGTSKVRRGVRVHRLLPEHVGVLDREPRALPVATAAVLTAARSGIEAGVVAMDAALHRGSCTRSDLGDALTHPGARYGIGRARRAVELASSMSESPGESRTRLALGALGLPVREQADIHDAHGFVGRVDFLVAGRVVVEFDGAVKYEGCDGRDALVAEKRREDRLRAAGYAVVRVTWRDLSQPEQLRSRILLALARAAA